MSISPRPSDSPKQARRPDSRLPVRDTMRSFVWEPNEGDEISECPDCAHWHARFEYSPGESYPGQTIYLREWHEVDCPCWSVEA